MHIPVTGGQITCTSRREDTHTHAHAHTHTHTYILKHARTNAHLHTYVQSSAALDSILPSSSLHLPSLTATYSPAARVARPERIHQAVSTDEHSPAAATAAAAAAAAAFVAFVQQERGAGRTSLRGTRVGRDKRTPHHHQHRHHDTRVAMPFDVSAQNRKTHTHWPHGTRTSVTNSDAGSQLPGSSRACSTHTHTRKHTHTPHRQTQTHIRPAHQLTSQMLLSLACALR